MTATTRRFDPTGLTGSLCVSFELGEGRWLLSFTTGFVDQVLRRGVAGGDTVAVLQTIGAMKERLDLETGCRVVSCYEAGRAGFWLHRFLVANGVENLVVDSSSIEVSGGRRRAKTDLLDGKLEEGLERGAGAHGGAGGRPPPAPVAAECKARLDAGDEPDEGAAGEPGVDAGPEAGCPHAAGGALRQWDGSPLPAGLAARLTREWERGMSKAGNRHVRAMAIEIAWG